MERKVWWNGSIIDEKDARIPIYDASISIGGVAVFEMTRSFNKVHFKLDEHIDRLFDSAKLAYIDIPYSKYDLIRAVDEISKINDIVFNEDDEYRILIHVTPGVLSIYKDAFDSRYHGSQVIITCFPLKWTTRGMGKLFSTGINAVTTRQNHIPSFYLDPKIKHRNRLHFWIANHEASKMKGDNNWVLLTNGSEVLEGCGANFFIVKRGTLYTSNSHNILRGISRSYIFELCNENMLSYKEEYIDIYDVATADEAFFCATPFCILPVTRINNLGIGDGRVGEVTKFLLKKWSENVGVNIEEQIREWDKSIDMDTIMSPYQFNGEKIENYK